MGDVTVTDTLRAPVERVWAILRDFGNLEWGGITGTKLEGSGVGAVRTFTATGGIVVRERLEAFDEPGHALVYSIVEPSAIPWTGHLARIELRAEGTGTHITWSGRFVARDLSEAQTTAIVRGIFENAIGNLKRAVA